METAASIYWWAGPSTGITGALLLAWALFSDCARGRRRCPKCWYNMSGSPGLRCSECGYLASSDRKLFKARRRWYIATVAATLLIVFSSLTFAKQRQDGLWSIVPTTVLIGLLPYSENPEFEYSGWAIKLKSFGVHTELRRHIHDDTLAEWQWEFLFWQIKRDPRFDFSTTIVAPSRWVAGEPVPLSVKYRSSENLPIWLADVRGIGIRAEPRSDGAVAALSGVITRWAGMSVAGPSIARVRQEETPVLGKLEPGTHSIPIDITWTTSFRSLRGSRIVWRTTVVHTITIYPDIHDVITPSTSSETDSLLISELELTYIHTRPHSVITLSQVSRRGTAPPFSYVPKQRDQLASIGATATLRFQGMPIAEIDLFSPTGGFVRSVEQRILEQSLLPPRSDDLRSGLWTVHIESNPLLAMHDYTATKYWKGIAEGILIDDRQWRHGRRKYRIRPTEPMKPVWSESVAVHFGEGLAIAISRSGEVQVENLLGIDYEYGINPSEEDHSPDFVIGGTLTIYCDEEAVIEVDLIQSERRNRTILEQRLLVPSFPFSERADVRARSWSVSFQSDPQIAMYDFEADKYWCGSLAGQLRFVSSRSSRMRINQGSVVPCDE